MSLISADDMRVMLDTMSEETAVIGGGEPVPVLYFAERTEHDFDLGRSVVIEPHLVCVPADVADAEIGTEVSFRGGVCYIAGVEEQDSITLLYISGDAP